MLYMSKAISIGKIKQMNNRKLREKHSNYLIFSSNLKKECLLLLVVYMDQAKLPSYNVFLAK